MNALFVSALFFASVQGLTLMIWQNGNCSGNFLLELNSTQALGCSELSPSSSWLAACTTPTNVSVLLFRGTSCSTANVSSNGTFSSAGCVKPFGNMNFSFVANCSGTAINLPTSSSSSSSSSHSISSGSSSFHSSSSGVSNLSSIPLSSLISEIFSSISSSSGVGSPAPSSTGVNGATPAPVGATPTSSPSASCSLFSQTPVQVFALSMIFTLGVAVFN